MYRKTQVFRPVFILGHYRSGTTHLQNLLTRDFRFVSPNYLQTTFPKTFLSTEPHRLRWGRLFTMRRRPHDNMEMDLKAPAEDELALCAATQLSPHMMWHFPRRKDYYERYVTFENVSEEEKDKWIESFRTFAQKLSYKNPGKTLVFKSPAHTARIPLILKAFPDAQFIHIHRNPYTVFSSTVHMERHVRPLFTYQWSQVDGLHEFVLRRYKKIYEKFFQDLGKIPERNFKEISFQQLEAAPIVTLREIYQALQLPDFEEARLDINRYLTVLKCYQKNNYHELSPSLKMRIAREWKTYFAAWDYPLENVAAEEAARGYGLATPEQAV